MKRFPISIFSILAILSTYAQAWVTDEMSDEARDGSHDFDTMVMGAILIGIIILFICVIKSFFRNKKNISSYEMLPSKPAIRDVEKEKSNMQLPPKNKKQKVVLKMRATLFDLKLVSVNGDIVEDEIVIGNLKDLSAEGRSIMNELSLPRPLMLITSIASDSWSVNEIADNNINNGVIYWQLEVMDDNFDAKKLSLCKIEGPSDIYYSYRGDVYYDGEKYKMELLSPKNEDEVRARECCNTFDNYVQGMHSISDSMNKRIKI